MSSWNSIFSTWQLAWHDCNGPDYNDYNDNDDKNDDTELVALIIA